MAFSVEEFKQQNPQFQNIPDEEILAMYEATAPSREVQQSVLLSPVGLYQTHTLFS